MKFMTRFLLYENGIFPLALFLSASIHGLLIGASGWVSVPRASVIEGPSSLEVTVISHPVVSVVEDEIVSEEILDSEVLDDVVFIDELQEPGKELSGPSLLASQESQGAVTKAEPLLNVNPAPPYPRIARQRGWEGMVRLEVFVGKDGNPGLVDIQESSGHNVLDRAAMKTVEQWKFSPAKSGTIRFPSRIVIPIQFTLIKE